MSQLNVDDIYNNGGDGGVSLPAGVTVSGISTVASVDLVLQGSASGITSAYWDASDSSFKFNDNCRLKIGTSSDLQLVHDGSNSFIHDNGTGDLILKGTAAKFHNQSGTTVFQIDTSGVSTATTRFDVGSTIQAEAASGIVTATAYSTSSGQQIANRNVIDNGAMTINQRGVTTQVTILYSGYYTVDRWRYWANGGSSGTWTMVQDTDVPDGQGFKYSLKTDCQVANASPDAADYILLTQSMEGYNLQRFNKGTSDAKTMTLSFWAKSTLTGNFVAELNDNDNSRTVSALFQTTTSWKKHVITFPADTTGAFGDDNGLSLYVNFWLSAGSTYTSGTLATTWASATDANRAVGVQNLMSSTSNNFWVTGVQLEAGSVATPFEFTKYGHELATSQRYYYRNSGNKIVIFNDYNNSTSNFWAQMYLPVTMRAAPTATVTTIAAGAITSTSTSIDMLSFNASNGATHFDNSTVIEASAEL